ncbi:uncharacterized protein F5147DRAFT_582715 [Suillus discolor]|uniref:CxC5 like cysteine cluster associated with KDZ domain-containing protein n=1 Tax=Suillus discolor TaxID=1912936 RepID=A0A9P7F0Q9_9AGAM|nr:uncharacterized protein F5147DRAFT_582715 [Suillus discolor]KAG2099283.1 hypothetical protein F5147DRAFT_582715 [Suillus discolor]
MTVFNHLLRHLEQEPGTISNTSLTSLFQFITLATRLKNDIILVEPSLSPTSDPPFVLSPAVTVFLSAGCSISPAEVNDAWSLLKDVIWSGGITVDVGRLWETHGTQRGLAEYLLYPPSHSCLHPDCQHRTKGMTLKKAAQTYVVLFTMTKGPCIAKSVHLYCQTCGIDYHHNYSVFKGERTYYEHQPDSVQAADHVFIEKSVIELFRTAMDFSWTSATNCAKLYNLCLSHGKQTPADFKVKFELSVEHVWDGYVITSLLEDCERRMNTLVAPHTGEQRDRFTEAMIARNRHIQLYGYEQVRRHYCNRCTSMYKDEQGVVTHKVSAVVVDGVTVGHPCCAVYNCHTPLSNNHHHFCHLHSGQNDKCVIIGCDLPIVRGRRTCSTLEHRQVEDTHELRGQSRFQLQERLARARTTIATNTSLTDDPPDEEEYEFNENTRRALPATSSSQDRPGRKKFRAVFGRRRTHNEQLIVAPCGMIIARRTFFGAEGVASVKQFIKEVYAGEDAVKPNHIFFDNNCTLAKLAMGDPFFDNIGLSVDVFHFKCKHSQTDTFCQENCNPEAFPELHRDDGKGWRFNSSVAEQTNNWFGKYHPIAREMLAHKFNFFCELILRRNHRTEEKLGKDGHNPRIWPCQQVFE